jgi:type VI secretion system protein ImpJ
MHLAQHHFQTQSRWFEDLAAFSVSGVHFRPYGLAAIELDAEALLNGTVSIVHARGILPEGTPFDFPHENPPPPLEIGERFSPTRDAQRVFLGLPARREGRANYAGDGTASNGHRYRMEEREIVDETTGADPRSVPLARGNFRLLLEDPPEGDPVTGDWVTLPIARIRRDGAGHFLYDARFIPPSLQIGASPSLLEMLSRLVDVLGEKAAAMSAERAGPGDLAEYASREVASFWLSHTIHSAIAPLRHLLLARSVHPERLYLELSRLAGSLCTFALEAHPGDLPLYDHDEPERTFEALDRSIRAQLDVTMPTAQLRLRLIPAEPRREGDKDEILVPTDAGAADSPFRVAKVEDPRSVEMGAEWYLGIRSRIGTGELISGVPRLVKICAGRYLVRIVKEAYPGLGLEHVASPPAELAPRLGTTYFRILRTEPCWRAITDTSEVGVYIPSAIPDAEPEIVVVPGRSGS